MRWEAEASSAEAYHVRAHPTVDTFAQRAKYLTGNRLVRAGAGVRDYTFYALVPGITYRVQVCRVTAIHTLVHNERTHSVPSFDTRGGCSPWQSVRLPAAADADRNDVKVSLEFPNGNAKTTLTPDTHGTLNYRVRLSGINDLSQYESPRWGAGSWTLFLKPSESRKTHRLGPGYGQVPEYFGHVARGANLSHLTWDRPTSGYIDQEFTLTSTQRGRGPLIVELFDHRTNDRHTDLGTQRKLCVDFEDAMGDVAAPCPGESREAADPPTVDGTPVLSGAGDDGSWSEGEKVGVTVTFSEAVEVDTTGGTPSIGVTLGGPGGAARSATYESGSGTTELVFGYTLVQADGTHQHMAVTPNSLATGGGAIRGAESGVDANLAHAGAAAAGSLSRSIGPTATFRDVPASHDGATAFKLELRFSGAPAGLNAKRDAASVLEVTGGSVTKARQTASGANPVWGVTVTPDGAGEVTVRVPARACSETHAVCIGGRPLGAAAEAAVPGPAMTARFTQAPASHDGSSAFELTFAFSHAPTGYSWSTVRDRLFAVTGGRIEKAGRLVKGSNLGWTVRVVPDGDGDVTLDARATTDCAAQHAACDAEGRRFDGELETTVAGPAGIAEAQATVSVAAPATTPVTEGTPLDFTLTRTGATDAGLTVSVSVSETGAVLGNAPPTTASFAAGSATATLSVPTVDDETAEDASTVTVTVTAGTGYAVDADAGSASGTVESDDLGPITARFTQVPAEHDGSGAFEMRFAFSHAPTGYNWTTVRDRLFEVTGGRIEKAGRLVRGSNLGWKIRVRPDGLGPVTLDARATTDCAAQHAACDAAGRRFDGELRATVLGPPTLSVADAEVEEADGATLDFVVTLSRAVPETVTVAYATSDGTAAAGDDYAAANGTLTFAASEVSKTVSVPVLDDTHNEGSETVTFTLSNPDPARVKLADAEATGTITNTDAMPRAWLARFGRAVAEGHVDAVRDRLGADRSPGFSGRFAGQPLPRPAAGADGTGPGPDSLRESRTASLVSSTEGAVPAFRAPALPEDERLAFRSLLADADEREDGAGTRTLAADDVLLGTSFAMMQDSGTGLSTGFWGRAARTGFGGRNGETDLDGEVTSVMLGTDWKRKGTLFGLIVSGSRGTGTYDGASPGGIDARLAALVPFAGREIGEGLSVWAAAGIGSGETTLTPEGADPVAAGIDWTMAAAGAEGALAPGERLGGAGLGWHADALRTRTASDAVRSHAGNLAATSAATTRLRLGVTADWRRTLASGATLGPRLEAGLRHDGGDAETGFGLEIGGGIGFSDPARGLSMSLDGRTLALHEDGAFGSWGLSLGLSWDPRPETRRGWSLAARQSFGGASSGGVDALLGPEAFPGLPEAGGDGDWSLEAAWGTGRGHGMVGSPYGRADGRDGLRLGYRIEPDAAHAADASLDLWAGPGADGHGRKAGAGLQWRW